MYPVSTIRAYAQYICVFISIILITTDVSNKLQTESTKKNRYTYILPTLSGVSLSHNIFGVSRCKDRFCKRGKLLHLSFGGFGIIGPLENKICLTTDIVVQKWQSILFKNSNKKYTDIKNNEDLKN